MGEARLLNTLICCELLPYDARMSLQDIAKIDPEIPAGWSPRRTVLLDTLIAGVKLKYPRYFK